MADRPTRPEMEVLTRLADGLGDDVLKKLFPKKSPDAVRKILYRIAGITTVPAESGQLELPGGGKGLKSSAAYVLHTDGASRGNPGEAGAGACIFDSEGNEVFADRKYIGQCTNNVAEYQALLLGLQGAALLKIRELEVRLDSELIVRQLAGRYRVKDAKLKPMFEEVRSLLEAFESCRVTHVPRAENKRADELANQAIDNK